MHCSTLEILDRAVRRDCVLTLQALAEFFHAATRKRMVARTEAAAQLRWATAFPTASADPGALWMALEFAADGRLSLWDALLLTTAERYACEIVLSEDMQDGARFGRVTIVDPFVGEVLPGRVVKLLG
jgi:predicted nucleic acid-binding protein